MTSEFIHMYCGFVVSLPRLGCFHLASAEMLAGYSNLFFVLIDVFGNGGLWVVVGKTNQFHELRLFLKLPCPTC